MYKYKEFQNPNLETYIDVLKELFVSTEEKVNELLKIENKTYENFIKPYYMAYSDLQSHSFYLSHISSVKNTDENQKVKTESLPLKSEFYGRIGKREDIYEAVLEVSKTDLSQSERIVVQEDLLSKQLRGIGQEESVKNRIKEINAELSELSNSFSKNILDSTKEFTLEVTNSEDVKEFPEDELKRHEKEGTDHWEFTLQIPSYSAYMKYGNNSDIRKQLHTAYVTRAPENEEIIESLLTLRNEKAKLLGYNNYAEIQLLDNMAESPEEVMGFLDRLKDKSLPHAEKEKDELLSFVESEYGITELNPWDTGYYVNKYKEENFDFKSEDLKPYFEQSMVLNGMFDFLTEKFGLEFTKVEDTYTWDDTVKVYDVSRNGEDHSRVYFDLEAREDKRGGAWMISSQEGYVMNNEEYLEHLESKKETISKERVQLGRVEKDYEAASYKRMDQKIMEEKIESVRESGETHKVLPIAYVTCNFTPSTKDLPSLLSHGEINTLFHEMGHILQHICSEVEDHTYSGIGGIERDAVEWSSQFLELFVFEPDVLKKFAKHHETGETIPDELIEKINLLRTYREGGAIVRQLVFAMFDMNIHMSDETSKEYVQKALNDVRSSLNTDYIPENKFQCNFSHIFSGGYSAGYYSYKWAEVLSVDSFLKFKEDNNPDVYYNKFLAKGSSLPSMEMFVDYMGRKPSEENYVNYVIGE